MSSTTPSRPPASRELAHYPAPNERRRHLALVVLITVALYYALYVGSAVTPLTMKDLHINFGFLVATLAIGNALGAFASLAAGVSDRIGRAPMVVWGLLPVAILTGIATPLAHTKLAWAVFSIAVGCVEGVILVATPALIRDFSPQVGRATAMGFWTIGPVLGSLLTSAVASVTLPMLPGWRAQFVICGVFCFAVFLLAWRYLRELPAGLRDQVMVTAQDAPMVEAHANAHPDISAAAAFGQMLRPDILGSALGVSVLLLIYYTMVAFGVIYLVAVFGFSAQRANALLNFTWAANAVALIGAGVWSDKLRLRKPFMLVGGLGAAALIYLFMAHRFASPSFAAMAVVGGAISMLMGAAYATWMASFTETVEAHNPALTATGLAVWGWLLRLIVTASFLALPRVVDMEARDGGASWQTWFAICAAGAVFFVAMSFALRGPWRHKPTQA